MFLNEIDFPNQILDAIKNESLVVFAGAGASMGKPTSLPNFEKLAEKIAEGTGSELGKDDSCEVFLGLLKANGIDVNQQAAEILSGTCLEHNKLHEAIVDLFESPEKIKIVTTNYDQMFESVVQSRNEEVVVYNVPALPLGNDVEGIIHIHGNVNNPKYMVVTDEDFGRAYLTDGYASKFIVQLFESYTVLIIGYSYNDTIMKYLTRALSRNTKNNRYILTDNKEANWSVYGIKPIYFKKDNFAVMREGLVKLGRASKKGLIEWQSQFIDIKDMPPKDLTVDTEIDYCLEDYDRSTVLAKMVSGKEWLDYLDRKDVFVECFSCDEKETKQGALWADWLCTNCVGKHDESLLCLIYKHKNVISKLFAERLERKLLRDTDAIDIKYYMEYLLVLDKYLTDCWMISECIRSLVSSNQFHSAFVLFKKLFAYNTQLEKKSWLKVDAVECKHLFVGDYYHVESAWKMIKEKAIEEFPYEVIVFVIERITELHYRCEMANQASKDKEPWDFVLLELENREGFYRENSIQILSNMLLEASCSLQNQNKDLLRTTLLQGIESDSILLKKMTLKVIREVLVFSPAEKLNILLDQNYMIPGLFREQVFLIVKKIYPDLNKKDKVRLLDSIRKLEQDDTSKSNINEAYKWYVWLHKFDPDNERINERIMYLQATYNFGALEHPELTMWSSGAKWIKEQSPLSEEELIQLSVSETIDKLKNYCEGPSIDGPSRDGLLEIFSTALSKNKDWSEMIIHGLIDKKIIMDDIWQHVFYGLKKAEYELADIFTILMFIIQNMESISYIYGAAECLWLMLQQKDIKGFFDQHEQDFYNATEILWKHREQEKEDFTRTVDASLNTTIGCILFSWIYMVSFHEEKTIPEKYKIHFEEAIKLETWERDIAVCVLAGHFNFFCYRDIEWSKNNLVSFFTCDDKTLYTSAWEGMAYFSGRIIIDTADIIEPVYYNAIKHISWLEEETKNTFIELLLTLMIYIIDKPTQKYIPEFYKNASEEERKQLIHAIENRLKDMDEDNKLKWWNKWLKRFLENRKNNKPCQLGNEENKAITDLLTVLQEVFDEAVDIICKGKMSEEIDDVFWSELNDLHIAAQHSHSMARFLIKAMKNITSLSFGAEDIREIKKELGPVDEKENQLLKEMFIKWNIE